MEGSKESEECEESEESKHLEEWAESEELEHRGLAAPRTEPVPGRRPRTDPHRGVALEQDLLGPLDPLPVVSIIVV